MKFLVEHVCFTSRIVSYNLCLKDSDNRLHGAELTIRYFRNKESDRYFEVDSVYDLQFNLIPPPD